MSSQPPHKNSRSDKAESSSLQDEFDLLDSFCEGIELDDIGYDSWCDHHQNLDLVICVDVSAEEAKSGLVKIVDYSITSRNLIDGVVEVSRKKTSFELNIPAGSSHQQTFRFADLGDCNEDEQGDLLIKLNIR